MIPRHVNAAYETFAFGVRQLVLSFLSRRLEFSRGVFLQSRSVFASLKTTPAIGRASRDLTADFAAQANAFDANNSPIRVEHDKKRRQFVIRLNGSHDRAVLLYEYVGKKTVDLQHTEVPDAYRGRGIAKHLAKAAMDFVVEEDLKAHLTCWYIQKYVKENPQPQYFEHIYQ
uniref:Protein NATD1 n=1 Tax=Oreochromis niloticus TaxID=8128 RepID=A0A669BPX9_ORENI